jgi:hypothetical protein
VDIEREVSGPHDQSSQKGKIKKENNERRGTSRRERTRSPRQNEMLDTEASGPSRKRSFSNISNLSTYSLPSPEAVLSGLSSQPARTRQRHELDEEDLERMARFN